jgi:hypothetical protein
MKKLVISSLIAASAIALSAGAASAQGYNHRGDGRWMSINERQHNLDMRIERGLQRGDLNRREAMRLRREFNDIARIATGRTAFPIGSARISTAGSTVWPPRSVGNVATTNTATATAAKPALAYRAMRATPPAQAGGVFFCG